MDLLPLLHNTVCGGLAAAGFGVLFNVSFRGLPWCAASGALALALRTIALGAGWRHSKQPRLSRLSCLESSCNCFPHGSEFRGMPFMSWAAFR